MNSTIAEVHIFLVQDSNTSVTKITKNSDLSSFFSNDEHCTYT